MNKTTNYQLSQWERTDRVRMEDFNADNAKIDAAIRAVDQRADGLSGSKADKTALAAVEAKIPRFVTGTYTGTGGSDITPRHVPLPGRPKVVLIRTEYPNTSHHYKAIVMTDICVLRYHTYSSPSVLALGNGYALEDNGFTIPCNCDQNYQNAPQHYLAVI